MSHFSNNIGRTVAWAISSREDQLSMNHFFSAVMQLSPNSSVNTLMSDDGMTVCLAFLSQEHSQDSFYRQCWQLKVCLGKMLNTFYSGVARGFAAIASNTPDLGPATSLASVRMPLQYVHKG